MFAKYRSHWCYSWRFLNINPVHWRLLNIDHSVVDVCQTSTIKGSQCLLTIERLVDVCETLVLLLSTNKEAMFSKHWLFVNVPGRSLYLMSRNHHYSVDIVLVNTCSLLRDCWNMRFETNGTPYNNCLAGQTRTGRRVWSNCHMAFVLHLHDVNIAVRFEHGSPTANVRGRH